MKTLENLSYWEYKHLTKKRDLIVIGAGIVGLMSALHYKQKHPSHSVLILERGLMPEGASTKNAGFACFGSAGELLNDLETIDAKTVWDTVKLRYEGLQLLRGIMGDKAINYEAFGGYEIFRTKHDFQKVNEQVPALNKLMKDHIGSACYKAVNENNFGLAEDTYLIKNELEGQIDTSAMLWSLIKKVLSLEIELQFGVEVLQIQSDFNSVQLESRVCKHYAANCIVATNAFAAKLLPNLKVIPGRAQVLITEEIPDLKLKGSFHFEQGYYYFRNIDNRVLFGGGRNLDFDAETSFEMQTTELIQNKLDEYLSTLILPKQPVKIERRWSGIMGLGSEKKPIIQFCQNRVVAAVRMGGMGVAIGAKVGREAADLLS